MADFSELVLGASLDPANIGQVNDEYDGIVDIDDAFTLRTGLISSGLGSFNLELVLGTVPEPATWLMAVMSGALALSRRRAGGR